MAQALPRGGIEVYGCDVNSDRVEMLAREGDKSAPRAEAAARSDILVSVALSILPETDPDNFLLPLAAYSTMRLGKVTLLPYCQPGDPAAGERSAVVLANRGPVVAAKELFAAVEALEEDARLVLLRRGGTLEC